MGQAFTIPTQVQVYLRYDQGVWVEGEHWDTYTTSKTPVRCKMSNHTHLITSVTGVWLLWPEVFI